MWKMVVGAVLAVFVAAASAYALQRQFGREWTKVGDEYHRTVEVKVKHSAGGNVSNYKLPLENGEVFVREVDDGRGFTVGSHPYGEFQVVKDDKGRVTEYSVVLGNSRYFDLNGDGSIDAMYTGDPRIPMIVFEGRTVRVEDSKTGFGTRRVWAEGRGAEYLFEDGRWRVL